jgi:SAM-dependent methyltransferase
LEVDPSNTDQARSWDGDQGTYWATHADHFDRALATYHDRFLSSAAIAAGELIIDIGCGTGQTTRDAARAAADGRALGVDLSARMIERARRLAAEHEIANAAFEQADAQIHPFETEAFDVAISRTGTMFFGNPTRAFANIARALRPGGRLTMLVWQGPGRNEWIRELTGALAAGSDLSGPPIAAPGPFAQSNPETVRSVLTAAGFFEIECAGLSGPMRFGQDAQDAEAFVLGLMGWMLRGLDEAGHQLALDHLRTTLAAHETGRGVLFDSAAWLILAMRQPI